MTLDGHLLLVLIDANGEGWTTQKKNIEAQILPGVFPATIVGCPDPYVEAWCTVDPDALRSITGKFPPSSPQKSGRGVYKEWLRRFLEDAGIPVLNDPMDIAADLVPEMDLYRAGKASPSLRNLTSELKAFLEIFRAKSNM